MSDESGEPRLYVDSDWKEEARREKERLAEQEAKDVKAGPLPDPSFLEIVNMLAMQAAVSLSGFQLQSGEQAPPDLPMARHLIDLLEVLDGKTKGNLTPEEKTILDGVLYEMRMRYVQAASPPGGPPAT